MLFPVKLFFPINISLSVFKVMQEKLKKTWMTVDAQTNQKEVIKRETVYCLDDDNETEVQVTETIQGKKPNKAGNYDLFA